MRKPDFINILHYLVFPADENMLGKPGAAPQASFILIDINDY